MKITLLTIITAFMLSAGCGTSKQTSQDDNGNHQNHEAAENEASGNNQSTQGTTTGSAGTIQQNDPMNQPKQEAVKYRLILSFISIGEGTDPQAREIMDRVLAAWETKTGKKIAVENYPWGREGEVDFCFHLNELSPQDQAALAREMRVAFKDHQLVQISEFQASPHKR